ncbi:branched-chain amino acid ABC transporter permease, partial [Maribellus luteus]
MSGAANMTNSSSLKFVLYALLLVALIAAPLVGAYPVFVAKLLCFALFASAF